MRECSKCGQTKPLSDFYKRGDGHRNDCKECFRTRQRARDAENREAKRAYNRKYYEKNPDKFAQYRANEKRRYQEDEVFRKRVQQRYSAWAKAKYANDPEYRESEAERRRAFQQSPEGKEWLRQWRLRKYREDEDYRERHLDRHRRWRKRQPEDIHVARKDIFKRDKGICRLCGEPVDPDEYQLDHIVPRSLGGVHRPENLQIAHPACNRDKSDKLEGQINLPL